MAEIIKETIRTQATAQTAQADTPVSHSATQSQTTEYIIYFFFGALDILLAFRLVLKLLGASTTSGFVRSIYSLSGIFTLPFEGIFRKAVSQGIETASVLEPATLVALIVYPLIAWGVVKLVHILSGEQQAS